MLNQCQFIGHLGADPEVRNFSNGGKVCNLRLACTEKWKSKDGERKEKTEWISIAIFNEHLVRLAEQYLRKGSKVFVSGKLETRKWQDQSGQDRYSTEVVLRPYGGELTFLDGRDAGGGQGGGGYDQSPQSDGYGAGGQPSGRNDIEDEIPFAMEWRA